MLKRMFSVFVCSCLIATICSAFAYADDMTAAQKIAHYSTVLGDVDRNGTVDVNDARTALRIAVGLETNVTAEATESADVDVMDGVTVSDARSILRYAVGLSGFEIPVSKDEVLQYFVQAADSVKLQKPGLDRKTTTVCPSIRVTISGTEVDNWEMSELKTYTDEQIKKLESYRQFFGVFMTEEEIKNLDAQIAAWNAQKDNIDKAYEPQIQEFHVEPGNSHYAAFTVRGKTWSSKATADDVAAAKLIYLNGVYSLSITYNKFEYTTLPTDMTTLEYGRMFDLPSYSNLTKPSRTDFTFNKLTLKDGTVSCNIDAKTGSISDADYYFSYIWDYTVTSKDSSTGKDVPSRYVYTVNNTAEYTMTKAAENA